MSPISLLNWMLLSTALLGAWWLCYRLALRQERSFAYNRAFLVLGPLLAAGLPLLPLGWAATWLPGAAALPALAGRLLPVVQVGAAQPLAVARFEGAFWLQLAYLAGVGLLLLRLGTGLGRLWWHLRSLPHEPAGRHTLVKTHGRLPTSSFGRFVFWDETLALSPPEARQMLRHELAHIGQGHSYDRVLLEVLRAVLWFNPFVHLCGRALALTHEYLADEAALCEDVFSGPGPGPTAGYTRLLARQAGRHFGFPVPLAHSFSYSHTLRRIAMIHQTNPIRRWKQWLALPLLGILVAAVACEKVASPIEPAAAAAIPSDAVPPATGVVYETADQMPELPGGGGPEAIVGSIQAHLAYPNVAPASRNDGKMFVSFTVSETGAVQAVKILKSLGPAYDAAVTEAIRQLPRFVPGRIGTRPVAVSYTVPILFVWKPSVRVVGGLPLNWEGWAISAPGTGC